LKLLLNILGDISELSSYMIVLIQNVKQ